MEDSFLNQDDGGEQSSPNSMTQDGPFSEKKASCSALLAHVPNYSWIGYFISFDFWLNFFNFPNHRKNDFPLLLIQLANCLVIVFHPIPTVLLSFLSPILFCSPYRSFYLRRHMYSFESHSWSAMKLLYLVQSDETEKLILDYKEKIEFYRNKMQDLVSSCFCLSPPLLFFLGFLFTDTQLFCQYLMHENQIYTMKSWVLRKWWFQTLTDACLPYEWWLVIL